MQELREHFPEFCASLILEYGNSEKDSPSPIPDEDDETSEDEDEKDLSFSELVRFRRKKRELLHEWIETYKDQGDSAPSFQDYFNARKDNYLRPT